MVQDECFAGMSRAMFGVLTYDSNLHFYTPGNSDVPHVSQRANGFLAPTRLVNIRIAHKKHTSSHDNVLSRFRPTDLCHFRQRQGCVLAFHGCPSSYQRQQRATHPVSETSQ